MTGPDSQPLVAVVYGLPLFYEALVSAFDGIARVQGVPDDDPDLDGLLEALRPDAVVVQSEGRPIYGCRAPAVYVDLERQRMAVLADRRWRHHECTDLSPERIRNTALATLTAGVDR